MKFLYQKVSDMTPASIDAELKESNAMQCEYANQLRALKRLVEAGTSLSEHAAKPAEETRETGAKANPS